MRSLLEQVQQPDQMSTMTLQLGASVSRCCLSEPSRALAVGAGPTTVSDVHDDAPARRRRPDVASASLGGETGALAGNKRNLSIGLRSLEDQLLERTSKLYETWDFCVFHSGLSFASRTWIDDNRHRLDQNMVFGHRSL